MAAARLPIISQSPANCILFWRRRKKAKAGLPLNTRALQRRERPGFLPPLGPRLARIGMTLRGLVLSFRAEAVAAKAALSLPKGIPACRSWVTQCPLDYQEG